MSSNKQKIITGKPKKPASAYILFCNDKRESVKKEGNLTSIEEIGRALGDLWKKITEVEKDKYQQQYLKIRSEYVIKFEEYKQTPEYEQEMEEKRKNTKKSKMSKTKKDSKLSAYSMFSREYYANAKKSNSQKKMGESTKEISEQWSKISKEDKLKYQQLADQANKEKKENKAPMKEDAGSSDY